LLLIPCIKYCQHLKIKEDEDQSIFFKYPPAQLLPLFSHND